MSNKQNHPSQSRSSIYLTHQPKSRNRYPLVDREVKMNKQNSILDSPAIQNLKHRSKFSYGLSRLNDGQVLNMSKHVQNRDDSEHQSMQLKFKLMHISSVHELIASAREKKSEIEDLLRSEALKAENDQQMSSTEIAASLRKLKKVVRLMEIVCKIIMGKNEQNSYMDTSLQHDVSMREMHSFSIDNYEKELSTKNNQIARLKKLFELRSVPNTRESLNRSQLSNNNDISLVQNSMNLIIESNKKQENSFSEIKHRQCISTGVQTVQLSHGQYAQGHQELPSKFKLQINEQYSLWNILDAGTSQAIDEKQSVQYPMLKIESKVNLGQKSDYISTLSQMKNLIASQSQTGSRQLGCCTVPFVMVQAKPTFLKRFKSMVKIALISITMCNNLFILLKSNQQSEILKKDIQLTSQYFNKTYNSMIKDDQCSANKLSNGKNSDQFCKEIRDKVNKLYDRAHQIYEQMKISREIDYRD